MSTPEKSLTECFRCDAPFMDVNETTETPWTQLEGGKWLLNMVCHECDWFGRVIATEDEVEEFDIQLGEDSLLIAQQANSLRDEVASDISRNFGDALRKGDILPEDF